MIIESFASHAREWVLRGLYDDGQDNGWYRSNMVHLPSTLVTPVWVGGCGLIEEFEWLVIIFYIKQSWKYREDNLWTSVGDKTDY